MCRLYGLGNDHPPDAQRRPPCLGKGYAAIGRERKLAELLAWHQPWRKPGPAYQGGSRSNHQPSRLSDRCHRSGFRWGDGYCCTASCTRSNGWGGEEYKFLADEPEPGATPGATRARTATPNFASV